MKISRIKETCLYVSDLDRTKAFYHQSLGLPLISQVDGRHVFFRAGESILLCFIAAQTEKETVVPPHGAHGRIHFAFQVSKDDYLATRAEVESKGIIILHDHLWDKDHRSFYFHDPDGNLIEIVEEGMWD